MVKSGVFYDEKKAYLLFDKYKYNMQVSVYDNESYGHGKLMDTLLFPLVGDDGKHVKINMIAANDTKNTFLRYLIISGILMNPAEIVNMPDGSRGIIYQLNI